VKLCQWSCEVTLCLSPQSALTSGRGFLGLPRLHGHRQSRILSTLLAEVCIERATSLGSQTLLCHDSSALVENPTLRVSRQTRRHPSTESRQVAFVARPTPLLSRRFWVILPPLFASDPSIIECCFIQSFKSLPAPTVFQVLYSTFDPQSRN